MTASDFALIAISSLIFGVGYGYFIKGWTRFRLPLRLISYFISWIVIFTVFAAAVIVSGFTFSSEIADMGAIIALSLLAAISVVLYMIGAHIGDLIEFKKK